MPLDPTPASGRQRRERFVDPIGFGFESYDAIGRFRTEEANKSIDATGQLLATRDIDGPFDGAVELAHRLAGSEQASDCFVSLYVEFALGRVPREADECSVEVVLDHFSASGGNLRALVIAVVASDAFRFHGVPQ